MYTLTLSARKVLAMILNDIEHLPQGYGFWHSLPTTGRKSQRCLLRKWVGLTLKELFPLRLRQAALLACLTEDGVPDSRGRALYGWLLKVVYLNQAEQLHSDWFRLKQAIEKQPALLYQLPPPKDKLRPTTMPRKGMYTWHEYPPAYKAQVVLSSRTTSST